MSYLAATRGVFAFSVRLHRPPSLRRSPHPHNSLRCRFGPPPDRALEERRSDCKTGGARKRSWLNPHADGTDLISPADGYPKSVTKGKASLLTPHFAMTRRVVL